MSDSSSGGKVVLSIDLDRADGVESAAQRELGAWLVHEAMKLGMIASWGFHDPSRSKLAKLLAYKNNSQELGIVVGSATAKRSMARGAFEKWLDSREQAAAQASLPLAVSLWQGAGHVEHLDVLAERGMNALRGARAVPQPPVVWHKPRVLRHGVWEMPPSMVLAPPSGWFGVMSQVRRVRFLISQARQESAIAHIVMDVPELSLKLSASQSLLRAVLGVLDQAKKDGSVSCLSVAAAVHMHRSARRTESARSILRADAA